LERIVAELVRKETLDSAELQSLIAVPVAAARAAPPSAPL
jgi:hypothetical protein